MTMIKNAFNLSLVLFLNILHPVEIVRTGTNISEKEVKVCLSKNILLII